MYARRSPPPIILENKRSGDYSKHVWENFEYLAYEMSKAMSEVDSGYKMPARA